MFKKIGTLMLLVSVLGLTTMGCGDAKEREDASKKSTEAAASGGAEEGDAAQPIMQQGLKGQ